MPKNAVRLAWSARWGWVALVGLLILTVHAVAGAEENAIDNSTVRVLALGGFDIAKTEVEKVEIAVAVPLVGHGSGFVASKSGVIVTAGHVVRGARFVAVHVPGVRGAKPARVVYENEELDVAFLRVQDPLPTAAEWDTSRKLRARQDVFAVGYPLDATRTDAQSTKGAVSSLMSDGRVQLSMSVNPGNSGGPVVDLDDNVQAVVSQGANVEAGVTGLAIAIPVSAFSKALRSEIATDRSSDLASLSSPVSDTLVELLVAEQSADTSLLRAAAEPESEMGKLADAKVRGLKQLMAKSPEIAFYCAAFFWNNHLVHLVRGEDAGAIRQKAIKTIKLAQQLDPNFKSTFADYALAGAPALVAVDGERRVPVDGVRTVAFKTSPGIGLHAQSGKLRGIVATNYGAVTVEQDVYEKICEGSCDVTFTPGQFQLALSRDEGPAIPVKGKVTLDGASDIQGSYESHSGMRIGGLLLTLGGTVVGTWMIVDAAINDGGTGGVLLGSGVLVGGLAGGVYMMSVSDEASIRLVPRSGRAGPAPAKLAAAATIDYARTF